MATAAMASSLQNSGQKNIYIYVLYKSIIYNAFEYLNMQTNYTSYRIKLVYCTFKTNSVKT